MEDVLLSLFEVSTRLGVSPSAVKKRVAHLSLPVKRGTRGKLLFDKEAFRLLQRVDELLKSGHSFEECRLQLGLGAEAEQSRPSEAEDLPMERKLPTTSVWVSLPRKKLKDLQEAPASPPPSVPAHEPVPSPAPAPAIPSASVPAPAEPEMSPTLDATFKLLEEKERQNQQLQAKLLTTYEELARLSATAAAFQERSLNLQHEVRRLESEVQLLAAPEPSRPWWRFWSKASR